MTDESARFSPPRWKLVRYGRIFARRYKRPIRFLFVGAFNTAFGYGIFAILYLATGRYRIAVVVATIIGVLFNFFTTGRVVFGNRDHRALVPFVLGYAFTLGLNIIVLEGLVRLGFNPLIAQAMTLPLVAIVGYGVNARIVFRTRL